MSIKHSWDDIDNTGLPVNTESDTERGRPKTTEEVKEEIKLEEILTSPEEAINFRAAVLKEKENQDEVVDKLESSIESLRSALRTVMTTGKTSREMRESLLEIKPTLSLESANEFTTVPSTIQADNVVKVVREGIKNQFDELVETTVNNYRSIIQKLICTKHEDKSITEELNHFIAKNLSGGLNQSFAINQVKEALIRLHKALRNELDLAREDIKHSARDQEILLSIESHLVSLENTLSTIDKTDCLEGILEKLLYALPQDAKDALLNSCDLHLGLAVDYFKENTLYQSITKHNHLTKTRIVEKLDILNQSLVDLYNALIAEDSNEIARLLTVVENNKKDYFKHLGVEIAEKNDDVSSLVLATKNELPLHSVAAILLNGSVGQLTDEMNTTTVDLVGNISGLDTYLNFYQNDILANLSELSLELKESDSRENILEGIQYLYQATYDIIKLVSNEVIFDVKCFLLQKEYFISIFVAYSLILDMLSKLPEINFGTVENLGEVQEALNDVKRYSTQARELFRQALL